MVQVLSYHTNTKHYLHSYFQLTVQAHSSWIQPLCQCPEQAKSLANELVGTGFTSQYRFQHKASTPPMYITVNKIC